MGHHGGEAAVCRGHGGEAAGASVGVGGVGLCGLAVCVHEAHGGYHLGLVAASCKVGVALAVGHGNRQAAARHACQKQTGRLQHFNHRQPRFEALALVGGEARPRLRTGDDARQLGKHLAAVAHAQAKGVGACKEGFERVGQQRVKRDAACPADACAQGVAVAEAAAGHHTLKILQLGAACLQVCHVHVVGFKACFAKDPSHFGVRVHALLAQDRDLGAGQVQERKCYVFSSIKRRTDAGTRVVWL